MGGSDQHTALVSGLTLSMSGYGYPSDKIGLASYAVRAVDSLELKPFTYNLGDGCQSKTEDSDELHCCLGWCLTE